MYAAKNYSKKFENATFVVVDRVCYILVNSFGRTGLRLRLPRASLNIDTTVAVRPQPRPRHNSPDLPFVIYVYLRCVVWRFLCKVLCESSAVLREGRGSEANEAVL